MQEIKINEVVNRLRTKGYKLIADDETKQNIEQLRSDNRITENKLDQEISRAKAAEISNSNAISALRDNSNSALNQVKQLSTKMDDSVKQAQSSESNAKQSAQNALEYSEMASQHADRAEVVLRNASGPFVNSFAGREGNVTPTAGDYTADEITATDTQGKITGTAGTLTDVQAVVDKLITLLNSLDTDTKAALSKKLDASLKGAAGGVAELGDDGKVLSAQLPSYVDNVAVYDSRSAFPTTGLDQRIYIAKDTNLTYRWTGSDYVEISQSLALGETSSSAYRGDRGKISYDHTLVTSGNPHKVTKADVGLGNVENTADADKSVLHATSADQDGDGKAISTTYVHNTGDTMTGTLALQPSDSTVDALEVLNSSGTKVFGIGADGTQSNVENDLTATESGHVLDARQGKVLSDKIATNATNIASNASAISTLNSSLTDKASASDLAALQNTLAIHSALHVLPLSDIADAQNGLTIEFCNVAIQGKIVLCWLSFSLNGHSIPHWTDFALAKLKPGYYPAKTREHNPIGIIQAQSTGLTGALRVMGNTINMSTHNVDFDSQEWCFGFVAYVMA